MLVGLLFGINAANAAIPATFLEQSSSITGASDTLKISRLPVRPAIGPIKYYDVEFKLQVDATGAPVLAPLSPTVGLSPALLSAGFKAGSYKDVAGNVFVVTGPGATIAGRTNWSILWTKRAAGVGASLNFQGTWTTGPIKGHPIEPLIVGVPITNPPAGYSWGTTNSNNPGFLHSCSTIDPVGFVQVGNQLVMHGFCGGLQTETTQYQLSLCTAANPCP